MENSNLNNDGYKIVIPIKPVFLEEKPPYKQVKFICVKCEMIHYVDSYEDIVKMEKTCNTCRRKDGKVLRDEGIRKAFMERVSVKCNSCNYESTRSEFTNGRYLKCPQCSSFDVVETKHKKDSRC